MSEKEGNKIVFKAGYKNRAARRGNKLGGKNRTIIIKGQGSMGW